MTEIIGTLSMKYASVNGGMIGHIVMYVMITASYVLLSVAVKRVALGVAYALWEGIGILFITLFSVLWFDEPISALKVLGLATLIAGIMLVKSGTRKERNRSAREVTTMQQFELYHIGFLGLAIVLEIIANIFLKMSDGFRKIWLGLLSLLSVLGAFSALAQAVKGIDLSIAYALWGGFGIAATIAAGWIMFGQRLNAKGWIGLALLLTGMVILKLS